jgi:integrase/recombinase XerC
MVEDYIAHRVERCELAPSSVVNIRATLLQWHRHAGPVDHWTPPVATSWCHDQMIRPGTRKMRRARLRPYTAWLCRTGLLETDIAADVPRVKVPARPPRNLDRAAVARLLAACPDDRATLIVTLMVQCGLRCIDLSRVLIEDIDTARHRLDVRAKGGSGDVTHSVHIPGEAWELLVPYVRNLGRSSGPLITNNRRLQPHPISAGHLSVLVRRWITDAGLKAFPYDGVSPHALRHTCAQDMLDSGARIDHVRAALGHRTATTTEEYYLRREPRGLAESMEGRRYAA